MIAFYFHVSVTHSRAIEWSTFLQILHLYFSVDSSDLFSAELYDFLYVYVCKVDPGNTICSTSTKVLPCVCKCDPENYRISP